MKVYFACRASLIWFPKYAKKSMAKNAATAKAKVLLQCQFQRDSVGKKHHILVR